MRLTYAASCEYNPTPLALGRNLQAGNARHAGQCISTTYSSRLGTNAVTNPGSEILLNLVRMTHSAPVSNRTGHSEATSKIWIPRASEQTPSPNLRSLFNHEQELCKAKRGTAAPAVVTHFFGTFRNQCKRRPLLISSESEV
jgi:hypothetical protein